MIIENIIIFLNKILFFTSYINNNGCFPKPLNHEDEQKYLKKMKEGDEEAKEILIRHNLRLVVHITKKYNNAAEADDLISVGTIGLIKGIQSFNVEKGCQLATYAAKCIENEILMYIRTNKKNKAVASLFESVRIDKEGNEMTLLEITPTEENFIKYIEDKIVAGEIKNKMPELLNKRELDIMFMRYGLGGEKPMTQLDVANRLNISRSYVSRIEKKAIKKIYNFFEK